MTEGEFILLVYQRYQLVIGFSKLGNFWSIYTLYMCYKRFTGLLVRGQGRKRNNFIPQFNNRLYNTHFLAKRNFLFNSVQK